MAANATVDFAAVDAVAWPAWLQPQPGDAPFAAAATAFQPFHRVPLNVALHLITGPLGLLGTAAIMLRLANRAWLHALCFVYFAYLAATVSHLQHKNKGRGGGGTKEGTTRWG